MARRRQAQTDATAADLPVELVRFVFGDWHVPADAAEVSRPGTQTGTRTDPAEDRAMAAVSAARARWRAARESWADAHGMDWRRLPDAVGPVVDRP